MASRKLYLYEDRIESIVRHFCASYSTPIEVKVINDNRKEIRISLEDKSSDKEKPGLLIFSFSKGMTSCQIAGNPRYASLGDQIIDEVEMQASVNNLDFSPKYISFHNVPQDVLDTLIDLWKEDDGLDINESDNLVSHILKRIIISSRYNSHVTLTYYTTNTLLIQGCVSTLFVKTFVDCKESFVSDETSLEGSFISILQEPSKKWIDPNLSNHFSDLTRFSGTSCEVLISTSITLLNSDIAVSDYSSMVHGIFRALEAIIGKKIGEVSPYAINTTGRPDTIGRDFNNHCTPKVFKSTFTAFDANPNLKRALERAYNHFYNHRNETFHADIVVPGNTVIITQKDEAINLAIDSIGMISDIIDNWI